MSARAEGLPVATTEVLPGTPLPEPDKGKGDFTVLCPTCGHSSSFLFGVSKFRCDECGQRVEVDPRSCPFPFRFHGPGADVVQRAAVDASVVCPGCSEKYFPAASVTRAICYGCKKHFWIAPAASVANPKPTG